MSSHQRILDDERELASYVFYDLHAPRVQRKDGQKIPRGEFIHSLDELVKDKRIVEVQNRADHINPFYALPEYEKEAKESDEHLFKHCEEKRMREQ